MCLFPDSITSINSTIDDWIGLPANHIPLDLSDLIQDGSDSRRLVSEQFQGTRESFQIECPSRAAISQSRRWTVWAVPGEDRAPELAIVMLEDLTGAALAEQHLRQAERLQMIGRLAGGVAHDFNNLLTGVLLYCDPLLSVLGPADRARKYAEEIRKAGLQASALVSHEFSAARQ